ncbi:hypothetical protein [Gordonia sp. 852002-51296_SCH5728562-b]|uniref:hypothetical protein n=1 Tax=Gordonia sp. 852002-51296_SCH5728562-b TaxID=1834101 RepID=UPI0012E88146|nr:hypothetical protein [Gordonia sp. 852002-51296_SCH5728562-b]
MRTITRRKIATAATGLALSAGALLGTALSTAHAEANVTPGAYLWHIDNLGFPSSVPATVNGNTLYAGGHRLPIHSTPNGGWVEINGQVYLLAKRGGTYTGTSTVGPFTVGGSTLTPRR